MQHSGGSEPLYIPEDRLWCRGSLSAVVPPDYPASSLPRPKPWWHWIPCPLLARSAWRFHVLLKVAVMHEQKFSNMCGWSKSIQYFKQCDLYKMTNSIYTFVHYMQCLCSSHEIDWSQNSDTYNLKASISSIHWLETWTQA